MNTAAASTEDPGLAYQGICVGGPRAGMIYTSGRSRVEFPGAANIATSWAIKPGVTFTYAHRQLFGLDLWAPPAWTTDEVFQELARHYCPHLVQP
jgi:hypothetical protein